jgi:hypothetical protein
MNMSSDRKQELQHKTRARGRRHIGGTGQRATAG